MKSCPVCQRVYADETLQFCLEDGATLRPVVGQPPPRSNGQSLIGALVVVSVLLVLVLGAAIYLLLRSGNTEQNQFNGETVRVNSNNVRNISSNAEQTVVPVERLPANNSSETKPTKTNNSSQAAVKPVPAETIVSSSSARAPDAGNVYFPNAAIDRNPATAWGEGVGGAGTGEWLRFDFARETTVKQISIQPGYFKSADSWRKNNRVAEVSLQFSDGTTRGGIRLTDTMQTQTVNVENVRTRYVKITINRIFPGANDSEDTLISEVSFVTEP